MSESHPPQPGETRRKPAKLVRPSTGEPYTHRNRAVVVPDGCLAVGYIAGVHGLAGELKVELHTDFPDRFAPGVILLLGAELSEVTVKSARMHKQTLLLRLEGIVGREEAEQLRGTWLFVSEEDAVQLEEDAYWVHDIIGMDVQTEAGEPLGVIREVLFTGANQVYVVEPLGLVNGGKEVLLPAITDVVRQVDLDARRMTVHLLPGLLEV